MADRRMPEPLRWVADDGVGIAYRVWPGEGIPVVLQHGFAVDTYITWLAIGLVPRLVEVGRPVVAIDARGHGASDAPHDEARYGEARMSRDLLGVVDAVGTDRYDLVGYSMGAVIGLITAATDRLRVRRLVAGGVGGNVVELGHGDPNAWWRTGLAEALLADDPHTVKRTWRPFRSLADLTGADREALAAHARSIHRTTIALGEIAARTLVLVGDDDPIAARPYVLADALPDARVHRLRGDHLTVFRSPAFVPAIVDFLQEPGRR